MTRKIPKRRRISDFSKFSNAINGFKLRPKVDTAPNTPSDAREKKIADLLGRFRLLLQVASAPLTDDYNTKEAAASQALEIAVQSNALVQMVEDLLAFTRELKELWIAGPLDPGRDKDDDSAMVADASEVGELITELLKKLDETKSLPKV